MNLGYFEIVTKSYYYDRRRITSPVVASCGDSQLNICMKKQLGERMHGRLPIVVIPDEQLSCTKPRLSRERLDRQTKIKEPKVVQQRHYMYMIYMHVLTVIETGAPCTFRLYRRGFVHRNRQRRMTFENIDC